MGFQEESRELYKLDYKLGRLSSCLKSRAATALLRHQGDVFINKLTHMVLLKSLLERTNGVI